VYSTWNKRLFEHFFNEENADSPVIIYVDRRLLDELGKDIGGCDGFVESIIIVNGRPQYLGSRLSSLLCPDGSCPTCTNVIPPFFAALCLTVLAWTVDAELHSGNYYGRLNGILQKTYKKYGFEADFYEIGLGRNQGISAKFREALDISFRLLELHTKEKFNADLGFYDFRQVGIKPIDIPRAQALLNAKDRARLELFFFEHGVQPEEILSKNEVEKLLNPLALHTNYLRQVTINCWKGDQKNRDVISEIVASLVRYWDGTYEDVTSTNDAHGGKRKKLSGAYLWPVFSTSVAGNHLGLRVEYTTQDFPITPIVFREIFGSGIRVKRQHGGWSQFFGVAEEKIERLLGAPRTEVIRSSDENDVRFFPKPVHIFELSTQVGGYIPAKDVSLGVPYLIFLNERKAASFLEANGEKLVARPYSPKIHDWFLYHAKEGLLSLDGLEKIRIRSDSKILELFGGAKIGHGASRKFSAVVPPQVKLIGSLPEGFQIVCHHGRNEIQLIDLEDSEEILFAIPEKKLDAGIYEFFIQDKNGERVSTYDSLTFKLLSCSMPSRGDIPSVSLPDVSNFLYKKDDFELVLEGWERVNNEDILFRPKDDSPLLVTVNTRLNEVTILCDVTLLSGDNGCYLLPHLEDGLHSITALWHGIEIKTKNFKIPPKPVVDITIIGATRLRHDDNLWLEHGTGKVELRIKVDQQDGLPVRIILAGEMFEKISNGSVVVPLSPDSINELQVRWAGHILQEESYILRPVPEILFEVDERSGMKWEGSPIYKPTHPPAVQALLEPNEYFSLADVQFFWGDRRLLKEEEDEEIVTLLFPANTLCLIHDTKEQFSMQVNNDNIVIHAFPEVIIQNKPVCDIDIIGHELEPDIYWQDNATKVNLSIELTNGRVLLNEEEIKPNLENMYPFPPTILSGEMVEKKIHIKLFWWDECIKERLITLTNKRANNIMFVGGNNIMKHGMGNNVYPKDAYPTQVQIEGLGMESSVVVKFGQDGESLKDLVSEGEGLFSLGKYEVFDGEKYVVEVSQGDITDETRFSIAGSDWLKFGYYEGQVTQLNEDVSWIACWLLRKNGRKVLIQRALSCPEDVCNCPCEVVLQRDKVVSDHKEKKRWKKLTKQSHKGISKDEKECWQVFVSGKRN
jgi:hypothetical protein